MRRLTFLLLCLFIGIGVATAQTMKITGNVISSEDQQPVIGAAVVVKGTTIGTVTDFEGNFSLDVPRDAKMIFISYVGLKTKEVPVASVINVVLDSDSKALDEVVVTAMGLTREKKALGYALQEVKSDELTKAGQQSLATSLSGKIAGVQITSQGGQVGASQNIVVRGNSSFGNNQPLIVVSPLGPPELEIYTPDAFPCKASAKVATGVSWIASVETTATEPVMSFFDCVPYPTTTTSSKA